MTPRLARPLDLFFAATRGRYAPPAEAGDGLAWIAGKFDRGASPAAAHYWRRTLSRAAAARTLGAAMRRREGADAFRAALTADVGIGVLLAEARDDYATVYETARWGEFDLLDAEREIFGFDHRQLTRRLLADWRLPTSIVRAIDESHAGDDRERVLGMTARLVYVAELTAAVTVDERAELWPTLCEAAERHLRLLPGDLNELDGAIAEATENLVAAFAGATSNNGATRDAAEPARRANPAVTPNATRRAAEFADEQLLRDYLRAAAIACREERAPLSVCFIEADGGDDDDGELPVAKAGGACAAVDWPGALTAAVGEARTAIILPRCDRRQALEWFDELRRQYRRTIGNDGTAAKLSVGIAAVGLPPRDLPVDEILAAAERCLHAAQSSAGDSAKSIELF